MIFQSLQVASQKLEFCSKMAKSGTELEVTTLGLHSGQMGENHGQRRVPHETTFHNLQRKGIG
ncbi:unnamed protein product [Linum tenue]|uniref:Uncharacterized protein n=2 Tax=Linum tenue TaxID=586396 RepID=A0AAV0H1N8_9ROSI|nr:unnamed protein product [Linum tenue]